jgi:hypothetical protein
MTVSTPLCCTVVAVIAATISSGPVGAQERRPAPKDSVRVLVAGCSKGYVFTAGPRTEDQPGGSAIPEGVRLRMSGPKRTIAEIKNHEGARVEITGLIKKGQRLSDGAGLGGGARISGGPAAAGGGSIGNVSAGHIVIDVEGWRRIPGDCPR